jgi:tRNA pseudouridine38-40 synthase
MRYFIRLSFKGTAYSGWQIQDNAVSVQGKLNDALTVLAGSPVETTGCGRTDTGVHATLFYAHFDTDSAIEDIARFLYSANAILPADIALKELFSVAPDAHARYSATGRTYEYMITNTKNPFLKDYTHYTSATPDLKSMNEACQLLLGTRDFSCFSRSNSGTTNFICDIRSAEWKFRDELLVFTITANRFLRGMVRAVVGTMLDIGYGKMSPQSITELIASKDRSKAGASAPAAGLFLCGVEYPFVTNPGKGNLYNP